VTLVREYGAIGPDDQERSLLREYQPSTTAYIVSLPSREAVFDGTSTVGQATRDVLYCYDDAVGDCKTAPNKGLLTAIKAWNNHTQQHHLTSYKYDPRGNLKEVTDPNQHVTTITYDDVYHIFPEEICNNLHHCTSLEPDPLTGKPLSSTDANSQTTVLDYDELGRLRQKTYPRGGVVHREYLDWGNPHAQRVHEWAEDRSADGLWSDTYFDGLGRTHRIAEEGDATGVSYIQDTLYSDSSFQPYKQSHWYRSNGVLPQYELFEYDGVYRLIKQTHPDNTFLKWESGNDASRIDS
jgi:YD repeat-containing protein